MTKINLLPHRELKRKARRRDFAIIGAIVAVIGALIVGAVGLVIQQYIDVQKEKNKFIVAESKKLDEEIKEIAKLKDEIDSLKARQKAVEDLQADRNIPVHVLDELVKQTPEGVYLLSVSQAGMKITVNGLALNNARVADYIRNISNNSPWVAAPELVRIEAVNKVQGAGATAITRRLNDFTLSMGIQRQKAVAEAAPGAAAALGAAPAAKPAVVSQSALPTAVPAAAAPTPPSATPPAAAPAAAVTAVPAPPPAAAPAAPKKP